MIRVLHYGMGSNLGGIETYLFNLARTMVPSRFQFDYLYSDYGREPVFANELTLSGSRFFGVTPRRTSPWRNRADIEALFRRERFDILHFHAASSSYVEPVRAALRRGVKVVFHSHNAGRDHSRITRLLHQWNQLTLPWSDLARVAVSREAGRWMFRGRPFEIIYNGIDAESFAFNAETRERVREELGVRAGSFLLGHVGAFLPTKNQAFLIDVFAEVARLRPDARLAMVGHGPEENRIRQKVNRMGLVDQVLFLGRRTDVPDLMAAMDCLVFPSLHEGFGLVTVEAQASGLPCVVSDAVPKEAALTTLCQRLPLDASPATWARLVLDHEGVDRRSRTREISQGGFTLESNTSSIRRVYERVLGTR